METVELKAACGCQRVMELESGEADEYSCPAHKKIFAALDAQYDELFAQLSRVMDERKAMRNSIQFVQDTGSAEE